VTVIMISEPARDEIRRRLMTEALRISAAAARADHEPVRRRADPSEDDALVSPAVAS
jgi:hypothetical protein